MAPLAKHLGDVGPWGRATMAADLDDAGQERKGARTLRGAGAGADAPGNHSLAQRAIGLVVGWRQPGIIEHYAEGVLVVRQLAFQGTGLVVCGVGVAEAVVERGR